ncbi:hypothetical protein DAPPUDRAFT_242575 [Daphnia pulex]|uniref:Uncharacterized protein n=1 Tax=Daphnia pulex TaxID=6669 RepID=E9GGZ8_DAPPU|nr:hypothetical protein DAPPUDRAFT_242575 [Daphnia pulex]|eukprot:EFX81115.1 hypothetical protein DAPPUDRAFT_242575 [Daphnia pulex]
MILGAKPSKEARKISKQIDQKRMEDFSEAAEEAENFKKFAKSEAEIKRRKRKALAEVDAEVKSSMAMDPEPERTVGEPSDSTLAVFPRMEILRMEDC